MAQSSDFERLLHTVDVAVASGREAPAVPAEAEGGRLRALHNLRTLQDYIARWLTVLDSEHVDTAQLAAGARRTAEDLDAATAVLREIAQGLPVDRGSLPADRAPSVAELRTARTRGDILAAESAFAQRLALAHEHSPVTTRWSVTAGASRAFEAVSELGVRVRARAVLPSAFEADLARWSCPPSAPEAHYPDGDAPPCCRRDSP
ncbi:hypothetical protein ACWEO1_17100 [Kitasatospora cineracea]